MVWYTKLTIYMSSCVNLYYIAKNILMCGMKSDPLQQFFLFAKPSVFFQKGINVKKRSKHNFYLGLRVKNDQNRLKNQNKYKCVNCDLKLWVKVKLLFLKTHFCTVYTNQAFTKILLECVTFHCWYWYRF